MEILANKQVNSIHEKYSGSKFGRVGIIAWTLPFMACFIDLISELFVDRIYRFELAVMVATVMFVFSALLAVLPKRVSQAVGIVLVLVDILIIIF